MRKAIGFLVIAVSIGAGLYLHDKYINLLIEQEKSAAPKPKYVEFINDQILPDNWPGDDVVVGGLSGLDWSELNKTLYAVSDDRGGRAGPSRFYELMLSQGDDGKYRVNVKAVHTIKDESGKNFPDRSMDPEGIALDSAGWIYISSEGDFEETDSAHPAIFKLNATGEQQKRFNFKMPWFPENKEDRGKNLGVRENKAFESLDIHVGSGQLVTAPESALIQDGEMANLENGADVRLSFNVLKEDSFMEETAQHVYPLSPIPTKLVNSRSTIGVTDLVLFKDKKLLVLERAYLAGRSKNRVKLFTADCSTATDVQTLKSVKGVKIQRCQKTEIYDFDNLIGSLSEEHPRVDNQEGMTLGPMLPDGSQLLILVSDNNFSPVQRTQFLFFRLKSIPGWEM